MSPTQLSNTLPQRQNGFVLRALAALLGIAMQSSVSSLTAAPVTPSTRAARAPAQAPALTQAAAQATQLNPHARPPQDLRDTGLYAPGSTTEIRRGNLPFTPQYPLWSDGAAKRRWIYLPPGRAIDASQPDAWQFPAGTRLWKEFSYQGRPIETRYIELRADGRWLFASYVWSADGSRAALAPEAGLAEMPSMDAPDGRYDIPSRTDCLACHEGAAVPVLGFSALQLSTDRDPLAPHAAPLRGDEPDLRQLVDRGWLRHLPAILLTQPPRIAAASPTERAALGYLHANCGHCHNDDGMPAPVKLRLAQRVAPGQAEANAQQVLRSLLEQATRYRAVAAPAAAPPIVPGQPEASTLRLRMHSRQPNVQMPPLGTRIADQEALVLIDHWIRQDLGSRHGGAAAPNKPALTVSSTARHQDTQP